MPLEAPIARSVTPGDRLTSCAVSARRAGRSFGIAGLLLAGAASVLAIPAAAAIPPENVAPEIERLTPGGGVVVDSQELDAREGHSVDLSFWGCYEGVDVQTCRRSGVNDTTGWPFDRYNWVVAVRWFAVEQNQPGFASLRAWNEGDHTHVQLGSQ